MFLGVVLTGLFFLPVYLGFAGYSVWYVPPLALAAMLLNDFGNPVRRFAKLEIWERSPMMLITGLALGYVLICLVEVAFYFSGYGIKHLVN